MTGVLLWLIQRCNHTIFLICFIYPSIVTPCLPLGATCLYCLNDSFLFQNTSPIYQCNITNIVLYPNESSFFLNKHLMPSKNFNNFNCYCFLQIIDVVVQLNLVESHSNFQFGILTVVNSSIQLIRLVPTPFRFRVGL